MSPTNLSSTTSAPSSFVVGPSADNDSTAAKFVDRRKGGDSGNNRTERRQFGSSHIGLSDDGRELALASDQYKVQHHRRYLTCDEMLQVLTSLGYSK